MPKPFISSIIAAAGSGSRMKAGVNKQYLYLGGKAILAHTLMAFDRCELIDEIILVLNKNEFEICMKEVIEPYKFKRPITLVGGGDTRQSSMYNGLKKVNPKADLVITHDGARPLVNQNTLIRCVEKTLQYKATIVAVPVKDTIKVVDDDLEVITTPKRSTLWSVQTPQTFDYHLLKKAHDEAIKDNFVGTDDAMLVERLGHPIKLIKGYYNNIKITTPEDLIMAESIIKIVEE